MGSYVRLAQYWRELALFAEQTDAATQAIEAEAHPNAQEFLARPRGVEPLLQD